MLLLEPFGTLIGSNEELEVGQLQHALITSLDQSFDFVHCLEHFNDMA